jgi:hypothetical protein
MNQKEATAAFGIPENVIVRMAKEGLISLPLDDDGVSALSVLGQLWDKHWFIAAALKAKRARERTMLLLFPEYSKVDRYLLNTLLNEDGRRYLATSLLQYRVRMALGARVDTQRIQDLRKAAAKIRGRKMKLTVGKVSISYADILGL